MNTLLKSITDWVSTKRGMWITIIVWLVLMIGLSAGPKLSDYKVRTFSHYRTKHNPLLLTKSSNSIFQTIRGHLGFSSFIMKTGK
jgi:RND superfamily putative drug exporter